MTHDPANIRFSATRSAMPALPKRGTCQAAFGSGVTPGFCYGLSKRERTARG